MERENYEIQRRIEHEHWWYVARRSILRRTVAGLALPAGARVLDVGCGAGGNRAIFPDGAEVFGVEEDGGSRARAVEQGYREVRPGLLPREVPFDGFQFSLISLLDVLEHIKDDGAALAALRRQCGPGGWLLLTVPACKFLWNESDENAHHHRRYSPRRLRKAVRRAGFEPAYLTYFNTWLFPLIAGVRLLKKLLGVKSDELRVPPAPVNRLLTRVFASEERPLRRRQQLPIGVSLLMLARPA